MAARDMPGPLIGSGRSADIYALGKDRVLRRFRSGYGVGPEADLMIYLDHAGYPVPKVYDVDGPDLVMERLDGPDMLAELGRKPWLIRQHGRLLADLHNRLHQIQAPQTLRAAFEPGDKVLHMDLHPANVMLTRRGPVVIDWTNAQAGAAGADVAMAYLIMASSDVDLIPMPVRLIVGTLRASLFRQFLRHVRDDPGPHMGNAARERMKDPNVRPVEIARLQRMAAEADQANVS